MWWKRKKNAPPGAGVRTPAPPRMEWWDGQYPGDVFLKTLAESGDEKAKQMAKGAIDRRDFLCLEDMQSYKDYVGYELYTTAFNAAMTCLSSKPVANAPPPPLPKLPPLAVHKKTEHKKKKRKTLRERVEELEGKIEKEQRMRKKAEQGITELMQTTRQARGEAEVYRSALEKHGIALPPLPREEVVIE